MNWALKTDRRDRFVIDEVQTEVRHGRRLVWRNFDGERNQGENRRDASGRSDERPVGHKQLFFSKEEEGNKARRLEKANGEGGR